VDELFHGGPVAPSAVLISGPEGCGKTTRTLAWSARMAAAAGRPALAVSAEMSEDLVRSTATRSGADLAEIFGLETFALDDAEREARRLRPAVLVFDSVPTLEAGDAEAGTDEAQARVVRAVIRLARELGAVAWLITHATADGDFAGRRRLRFDVDAVAWLEPERLTLRKHRFGPAPVSCKLAPLLAPVVVRGHARGKRGAGEKPGSAGAGVDAAGANHVDERPVSADEPGAHDADGAPPDAPGG